MAGRHWDFIRECLIPLRKDLAALGQPLIVRVGEAVAVLEHLRCTHGMTSLHSHEETGTAWTFARDLAVQRWARQHGIPLREVPSNGVVRRLRSRDGWAALRDARMAQPLVPVPEHLPPVDGLDPGPLPSAEALGIAPDPCPDRQWGGSPLATDLLESFLTQRGRDYTPAMASPVTGFDACSRLSPHLAWGSISMRQVQHRLDRHQAALRGQPPEHRKGWTSAARSFGSRLYWRCHFIQKFEDEPAIEHHNINRAFDGMREEAFSEAHFQAFVAARTGYPFVDACLRALQATGWMNFRMRAMLMSFAAYHLWLHWREPALHLARLFTDYEPGIHFSQCQMQSGVTGINTPRIYSPIKQSQDQDPEGHFIRRWVPELAGLQGKSIHEPWKARPLELEAANIRMGETYPLPIVDHATAMKAAKDRLFAYRRQEGFQEASAKVYQKHGSRKRPSDRGDGFPSRGGRRSRKPGADQGQLDL